MPHDTPHRWRTYWYFHLPNFVLAALMYTLLGRALLGLIVRAGFYTITSGDFSAGSPIRWSAAVALVTPKAAAPVVVWLFGVVWLFWLRVGLPVSLVTMFGLAPRMQPEPHMERNFYYIGIAFFGMINGLFNPDWVLFSSDNPCSDPQRRRSCSAASPLTLMFASLMVSTATIIVGGIPAAIYEHVKRPDRRFDRGSRCGSGLRQRRS